MVQGSEISVKQTDILLGFNILILLFPYNSLFLKQDSLYEKQFPVFLGEILRFFTAGTVKYSDNLYILNGSAFPKALLERRVYKRNH
jgi:hypothetical protein